VAVHPWENRHLAIEEILCLSSFPADFKLTGNFKQQWGLVGNAVMLKQMEAIALSVRKALDGLD